MCLSIRVGVFLCCSGCVVVIGHAKPWLDSYHLLHYRVSFGSVGVSETMGVS